jgi:ABC-2 type transport system ATP-binding protein
VVASHLLGEIEQVCSYLLAIDAGHLLQAAPMSVFTQTTPLLAVEVEDGAERLAGALDARGLKTRREDEKVLVDLTGDSVYDVVRDMVAELNLPLVRIQQERQRLEDLFRDAAPEAVLGTTR